MTKQATSFAAKYSSLNLSTKSFPGGNVMTTRRFAATLAVLTVAAFALPSQAQANLILNPGFESDFDGDLSPDNWSFTGGDRVKDFDLGIAPHSGNLQWQFQGDNSTLSQAVTLADAGDYELSMWIAARNDGNTFNTVASGEVQFELLDNTLTPVAPVSSVSADYDAPKGTYVQWTRSFSGLAAGNYTVRVSTGDGFGANQGMGDDFSLTFIPPVLAPEPSTLVLAALSMVGLVGTRRRRRS